MYFPYFFLSFSCFIFTTVSCAFFSYFVLLLPIVMIKERNHFLLPPLLTSPTDTLNPNVSFRTVLAMVLLWTMIACLLVIQHMKQCKLYMLNHFAGVDYQHCFSICYCGATSTAFLCDAFLKKDRAEKWLRAMKNSNNTKPIMTTKNTFHIAIVKTSDTTSGQNTMTFFIEWRN